MDIQRRKKERNAVLNLVGSEISALTFILNQTADTKSDALRRTTVETLDQHFVRYGASLGQLGYFKSGLLSNISGFYSGLTIFINGVRNGGASPTPDALRRFTADGQKVVDKIVAELPDDV